MINFNIEAARRTPRKDRERSERTLAAATLLQITKLQLAAEQRIVLAPTITRVFPTNPCVDLLSKVLPNTVMRIITYPNQSTADETLMDIAMLKAKELKDLEAEGQPIDSAVIKHVLIGELVSNDTANFVAFLHEELPTYAERNMRRSLLNNI
jgi:hypothetical protein